LAGASQTFTWTDASGAGATKYALWFGTTPGGNDLGAHYPGLVTSFTKNGLPINGSMVYVRLWTMIAGVWQSHDYTYTAANVVTKAVMASPSPGSTLPGTTVTFAWSAAPGATLYQIWVGTAAGSFDLGAFPAAGTTALSTVATGLPGDGSTVYVRLYSQIGGVFYFNDYTYTAFTDVSATMVSPTNGSTLAGASQTFTWTDASGAGATKYALWFGTTPGGNDLGAHYPGLVTSFDKSGLPGNGSMVYVKLWTMIAGVWRSNDYSYRAALMNTAEIYDPPSVVGVGTVNGNQFTFKWNNVQGSLYQVWVGTSAGSFNLGAFPAAGTIGTQTLVSGLPANGSTIYVRMYTLKGGVWRWIDYTFTSNP
ncbi:MAG: hypothetical protein OEZ32_10735, partial [Nitrospinota bacterium]|nr:hypothetical protein [Nitrospinota bacterium]